MPAQQLIVLSIGQKAELSKQYQEEFGRRSILYET